MSAKKHTQNTQRTVRLGRRTFLRGLGASIALPGFSSLGLAKETTAARGLTSTGAPLRTAYLYVPNGVNMAKWRPQGSGNDYAVNESMKSLEGFKDDIQIVKGLEQAHGWGHDDGAGDHARGGATFLTGVRAKKTAGSDIRLGISADQVAANYLGSETRLSSLELSSETVRRSGNCDSGYSCTYQYNLSWRSATQPMAPESNPRLVFERLFGGGSDKVRRDSLARRRAEKRSILDVVMAEAKTMEKNLGLNDRQKLDEYITGVREIEMRIQKSESFGPPPDPGVVAPEQGVPEEYQEHLRLLFDMMLLAFKTDQTRVSSFLLAHDGSNRSFRSIGVNEAHHGLSHHKRKPDKLEKIAKIDTFYCEQLAYFLEKMRSTEDVDGNSLLHNSMIVWGSGLSDGDRHTHNDLPIILAGGAGGKFKTGRHVEVGTDVPLNNLYMRLLSEVGADVPRIGDSTGILSTV